MDLFSMAAQAADPATALDSVSDIFLSQGVMGAIVVALAYFILMLRAELRDLRVAHKTEIAAKDALIYQLQEDRLKEARIGFELASSNRAALDALLSAIRK